MEKNKSKCSLISHKENEAISFCYECKINMCNKCEKHHSELFINHHQYKLEKDKDINEIFTGICKEKNHPHELKYFCKTHNKLCCAECITKFKGKEHGQHTDCIVCSIEDIKDEKMNKLNENIKCLENLSSNLQESIKKLKMIFEKNEKNKEEIKMNIQKIFTKIRNALNDREDELLLDVDKKFGELFFGDNIIQESEKLPNKIKISLEKGKLINNNWNNDNLNSLINDCLNIEHNIDEINIIKQSMKKYNTTQNKFMFIQNEEENKQLLETIKNYGIITNFNIQKKIQLQKVEPNNGAIYTMKKLNDDRIACGFSNGNIIIFSKEKYEKEIELNNYHKGGHITFLTQVKNGIFISCGSDGKINFF